MARVSGRCPVAQIVAFPLSQPARADTAEALAVAEVHDQRLMAAMRAHPSNFRARPALRLMAGPEDAAEG